MTASPRLKRRSPRQRLALVAVLLALAACRNTVQTLVPEAQTSVARALGQAAPSWRWESAQVRADHVAVKACLASSGRCFDFTLTAPTTFCRTPAGPWCVRWEGAAPSDAEADPLVRSLSSISPTVWKRVDIPARPVEVFALCVALTLLPLAIGWIVGAWLRRRNLWRLQVRLLLAVLPPLIAAALLFRVSWGFFDLISVGLFASAGYIAGTTSELRLRPLLLLTTPLLLLCLGVGEWAARRLPPLPRDFKLPTSTSLEYRTDLQLFCGSLAYDEHWSGLDRWSWPAPDDHRPMVIHLGDSMVFGAGVGDAETAVEELNRRSQGVAHANFGIPGAAPDQELITLRRRFDRVPTARIVMLHFFLGNDLEGLDERMACANDGPVFDYRNGQLIERASLDNVRISKRVLVELTPPPYPIRALAPFSALARQSIRGFQLITRYQARWFNDSANTPPEEQWAHLALILQALQRETQQHGQQLILSVIPDRELLESPTPEGEEHWQTRTRLKALARQFGIETIDPWEPARAAVQNGRKLFLAPEWEFHFNAEGHRWYAEWLVQTLGSRLTSATGMDSPGAAPRSPADSPGAGTPPGLLPRDGAAPGPHPARAETRR